MDTVLQGKVASPVVGAGRCLKGLFYKIHDNHLIEYSSNACVNRRYDDGYVNIFYKKKENIMSRY